MVRRWTTCSDVLKALVDRVAGVRGFTYNEAMKHEPLAYRLFSWWLVGLLVVAAAPRGVGAAEVDWRELTTTRAVCEAYPDRVRSLMAALDLEREGLAAVRAAMEAEDLVRASDALLAYYREADTATWLREPEGPRSPAQIKSAKRAEPVLRDTFTFYSDTDTVPRRDDEGLRWTHRGPKNDIEWTWALNRHYHIRWLLSAYLASEREAFVQRLDAHLRDWVVQSLPYPGRKVSRPLWRGLEASFRVKAWAPAFFALQDDANFRPGTRLLLLTSLPEHAHYLRNFHSGANWGTMELSALGLAGLAWPEFKQASDWIDYSASRLTRELDRQVYPDGAQKELSASYHWVALSNFEQLAETFRAAGKSLPDDYAKGVVQMYDYLAHILRPDGSTPLNNDTDRHQRSEALQRAGETYDRPDWVYIATHGEEGERPDGPASRFFPWAGQLVTRSGWDEDARWGFFDVGPDGKGAHRSFDRLHLSIHAGGRDLLVDSGRFAYRGKLARYRRHFAKESIAHNVIHIDGRGHHRTGDGARKAIPDSHYTVTEDHAFARGHFDFQLKGDARHTRAVLFLPDLGWLVVDRIDIDRPRKIEAMWRFHPDCTVEPRNGGYVTADEGETNLALMPLGDVRWQPKIIKGQQNPLQGWYSETYNKIEANPTAIFAAELDGPTTFAWLITTHDGPADPPTVTWLESNETTVRLRVEGETVRTVTIPLDRADRLVVEPASASN